MIRWTSAGATSTPWVGSSSTSTRGSSRRLRPSRTFCWLPPDSEPITASGPVVTTPRRSIQPAVSAASKRRIGRTTRSGGAPRSSGSPARSWRRRRRRPGAPGARRPCRHEALGQARPTGRPGRPPTRHPPGAGWPVSNGTSDSRPEPSSPATPTISPRPTAKLAAASTPPARPSACRQAVAVPLRAARVARRRRPAPDELDQPVVVEPERAPRPRGGRPQDRHVVRHVEPRRGRGTRAPPHPSVPQTAEMPNRRSTSAAGRAAVGSSSTSTCVARFPTRRRGAGPLGPRPRGSARPQVRRRGRRGRSRGRCARRRERGHRRTSTWTSTSARAARAWRASARQRICPRRPVP